MATLNIEECELLGDSKYRAYISQVEKALRSFENTSEWADLISALGKLNKVWPIYSIHWSLLCQLMKHCDISLSSEDLPLTTFALPSSLEY